MYSSDHINFRKQVIHINNEQLKTVEQLLILGRNLNEVLESWVSVGIVTERMFGIEDQIIDMIFEQLDIDSESISPLAQSVYECISRDISIEELMNRVRLPVG